MKRIYPLAAALLGMASLLTACGAPGSSALPGGPSAPAGPGTPAAAGRTAGSPAPAGLPDSPGSVTIGSADFPEDEILAYLYAGQMKARGVHVAVHADIGERPAYIAALRDGSIGAVPEYSGSILGYLDTSATAKTPAAVYAELRRVAAAQGFVVTSYAPAQDSDTITVTKATATRYHLTTIASLRTVAGQLSLGPPEPLLTLPYGVPALRRVYGVVFQRFVPLPAGGTVTQTALRDGTVGAADIFSTDPAITKYGFVPLTDTKHIFAAQNVVPLFKRSVLTRPMAQACNAVSARLTTAGLRGMVGRSPGAPARRRSPRGGCRGPGSADRTARDGQVRPALSRSRRDPGGIRSVPRPARPGMGQPAGSRSAAVQLAGHLRSLLPRVPVREPPSLRPSSGHVTCTAGRAGPVRGPD